MILVQVTALGPHISSLFTDQRHRNTFPLRRRGSGDVGDRPLKGFEEEQSGHLLGRAGHGGVLAVHVASDIDARHHGMHGRGESGMVSRRRSIARRPHARVMHRLLLVHLRRLDVAERLRDPRPLLTPAMVASAVGFRRAGHRRRWRSAHRTGSRPAEAE